MAASAATDEVKALRKQLRDTQLLAHAVKVAALERASTWYAEVFRYEGRVLSRTQMKSPEDWSAGRAWLELLLDGVAVTPKDHLELERIFEEGKAFTEPVQSLSY